MQFISGEIVAVKFIIAVPFAATMRYQPRTFTDLPIYRTVGDVLFVGTRHDTNNEPWGKVQRFLNYLSQCNHLLLEGNEVSGKAIKTNPKMNNYEALALRRFNGQIHFLESDANYISLGAKYGMRPDLIGIYYMFGDFLTGIRTTKSLDNIAQWLRPIMTRRARSGPTLQTLNIEQTVKQFATLSGQLAGGKIAVTSELITIMGMVFPWYFERVRDYEELCPETQALTTALDGKKGVITGAGHTQYLTDYVSGKAMEKPPQWSEFVDSLETRLRDTVLKIEREILPPASKE